MLYNAITPMTEYGGQIVIALVLFAAHQLFRTYRCHFTPIATTQVM